MTVGPNKSKMVHAANMMLSVKNSYQLRHTANSRMFAVIREEFSKLRKGVPASIESRRKNSESNKGIKRSTGMQGKVHSAETKQKMSDSAKGQVCLDETKNKLRVAAIAQHSDPSYTNPMHIEEHKAHHKESCLARSGVKKECPYCSRLFSKNTYALWHGDKCKLNG